MSFDDKFIPVRDRFYEIVGNFFKNIAEYSGYPKNPGMPVLVDVTSEIESRTRFLNSLPTHRSFWPPIQRPENWFEVIFGPTPKVEAVPRYIYESKEEGFYNFYIENYKNIYFLPNWLSEFIQVKLHICLDITVLEMIREFLFIGLVVYFQIVVFRIALSWFIYINPYTFPWCYIVAAVDWTEEALQGVVPAILGVNLTASVFLGIIGVIADSLNHLVFTMPFLPTEGEETKLLINQQIKDVLVFHYLPILWYRYPIPNDVREFWYKERPDILNYMQKAYEGLDIQFLPENIVKNLSNQALITKLFPTYDFLIYQDSHIPLNDYITNEVLVSDTLTELSTFVYQLSLKDDLITNFFLTFIEKIF